MGKLLVIIYLYNLANYIITLYLHNTWSFFSFQGHNLWHWETTFLGSLRCRRWNSRNEHRRAQDGREWLGVIQGSYRGHTRNMRWWWGYRLIMEAIMWTIMGLYRCYRYLGDFGDFVVIYGCCFQPHPFSPLTHHHISPLIPTPIIPIALSHH